MADIAKTQEVRNYSAQRSYSYDSHDADGNFNGMTEEQWKADIRKAWAPKNLKASLVVLIFHDKDVNDDGTPKGLHVHAVIRFKEGISHGTAMKRTGCSRDKDCKNIEEKNKPKAFRYLLHITEQAIDDGKFIYSERDLEICTDGIKFNYHKAISYKNQEQQETKDAQKKLDKLLDAVLDGKFKDINEVYSVDEYYRLLGKNPGFESKVEHAFKSQKRKTVLDKNSCQPSQKSDIIHL